jgi:hypothetical protein
MWAVQKSTNKSRRIKKLSLIRRIVTGMKIDKVMNNIIIRERLEEEMATQR